MKYINRFSIITFLLISTLSWGNVLADCKKVKGRFVSQIVTEFPNGESCPSPIGFCTIGRFTGGLRGKFTFVGENLVANPDVANPLVQFTTGVLQLTTKKGTLTLSDATTVSFDTDGLISGLQTVTASTGELSGTTGRIGTFGVFDQGCISCRYKGEICTP